MKINELKKILQEFEENVIYDADLKKKTWFNIGGKAKVFFKANDLKDLVKFLKILNNKEKIYLIGAGSNTLITDEIFDGVVIKLGKNFNRLSILNSDVIISGTGVNDKKLSEFAADNSLSGFEFLFCIPGTVGGAIKMNAGCFGKEIKDILISVQALDRKGNIITIPAKEIKFEYRGNNLSEDLIFLSASFKGIKMNHEQIKENMFNLKNKKELNQPTKIKTSGSTFKNPIDKTSKKAWQLIKESVASDLKFGDACISEKHSNFFINKGNATFVDMKNLINFVEKSVFSKTGIQLEKEIKILEN
ncbi:UDP-N-acetylmuramate dehydrogenase [Candidatus Pelagibacter sp. HIMB1321]|uniref:UDP-N-acetylmuramate dehydrogenase n=1 Tax=Candidatus Pelagibacter sp. HIMB1321 TaxID=1388755 RepID=UPI000A080F9F|nr:UDP-N-acetylmuramate dehydrogenase [Candidatus Pelagibacter sp. HIMB1321]SMF71317.1 UDP-N-acetylmuramate dehydrogenase [Candidatus Pelagibacter sp. HIMB1321]